MSRNIHHDIYSGMLLLVVSIIFLFNTSNLPEDAARYPIFVLLLLALFSVLITINGVIKTIKERKNQVVNLGEEEEKITFSLIKKPLLIFLLMIIYISSISILGFFVSTTLFITVILYLLKTKKIVTYIFTVLGTNLFIYILFVKLLRVLLPQGILF